MRPFARDILCEDPLSEEEHMTRYARTLGILLCFALFTSIVAADESENHLFHVGINPFGVIYGSYKLDFGVPILGFLEVGGKINHFRGQQFANLIGSETPEDAPTWTNIGAVVRVFPSKTASGFFIGGRIMYLNINPQDPLEASINDATFGIDIGWRWKWLFSGSFGMFFQTHFGIQRWVFTGDMESPLGALNLPLWPSAGLHFGIFL
jgi:hypothetical protein